MTSQYINQHIGKTKLLLHQLMNGCFIE